MALRKATGQSVHGLMSDEFVQRLRDELNIVVYFRDMRGYGWNAKGTAPAPHCYRMCWVFDATVSTALLPKIRGILDECMQTHKCVPSPTYQRTGPAVDYEYMNRTRIRAVRMNVWTREFINDTERLRQVAIQVAAARRALIHAAFMDREMERARVATKDGLAERITYWQSHNLLPYAESVDLPDHVILWKHVLSGGIDADYAANTWVGEMGAPHRVGATTWYHGPGNACAGPYGAIGRNEIVSLAHPSAGNFEPIEPAYVMAIAVKATLDDMVMDYHSHGVATFKKCVGIAVYSGRIGDDNSLMLTLVAGTDVLPLLNPNMEDVS